MRRQKSASGTKPLTISVPPELRAELDRIAEQEGRSVSAVVVEHLGRLAESQVDPVLAAAGSAQRAAKQFRASIAAETEGLDEQALRAAVKAEVGSRLSRVVEGVLALWVASEGGSAVDLYQKARGDLLNAIQANGESVVDGLQARDQADRDLPSAEDLATGTVEALDLARLATEAGASDEQLRPYLTAAGGIISVAKMARRMM